jgi:hypothetical protein
MCGTPALAGLCCRGADADGRRKLTTGPPPHAVVPLRLAARPQSALADGRYEEAARLRDEFRRAALEEALQAQSSGGQTPGGGAPGGEGPAR